MTAYAFDDFLLDPNFRTLRFRSELIPTTPRAFDTLHLLLRRAGEVVEKDEFLAEIWGEVFVEESTLAQNILTLRKTLRSKSPDKEFIGTVARKGYRFLVPVREV